MSTEAATVIPHHSSRPDEIRFYVDAVGGASVAAQFLEVPQQRVHAWLLGVESTPRSAIFWLDEAFGYIPAPSGEG
jgi:hypothetical protein